jgi:hypothetical protein
MAPWLPDRLNGDYGMSRSKTAIRVIANSSKVAPLPSDCEAPPLNHIDPSKRGICRNTWV